MNLFTIKNNYPAVLPEALLIPEFRALWDRDTTTGRFKKRAVEDLAYVYYMMDYQSAYRAYPPEERKEELRKDIITRSRWKEDDEIKAAMAKYDKLQQTLELRLLDSIEFALEEVITYFNNVNFDPKKEEDGQKVSVSKINDVTKAVKDAVGLFSSINNLRDQVKKAQSVGTVIRGGGTVGSYEN